jgi:hypothetical protein
VTSSLKLIVFFSSKAVNDPGSETLVHNKKQQNKSVIFSRLSSSKNAGETGRGGKRDKMRVGGGEGLSRKCAVRNSCKTLMYKRMRDLRVG